MKSFKARIVLLITFTIVGCWMVAAVLARQHAASFFAEHENRIQGGEKREAVVAELRQEKHSLFRELAGIRVLLAIVAVGTVSITLAFFWRWRVSRPMAQISDRLRKMKLGTWSDPIPVEHDDEMGTLVRQFNKIGPELSFTAHQYAAASKLAAMALVGQRVVRRTMAAQQRLVAVSEALSRVPDDKRFQTMAVEQVRLVAGELAAVAADFHSEFQGELARVGFSPETAGGQQAA
jgi:methyl-accepting chemotaxis protein